MELWPMGSEKDRHVIAEANIENCGLEGTGYRYRAILSEIGNLALGIPPLVRTTEVFERHREQSVWFLLGNVVRNAMMPNCGISFDSRRDGQRHDGLALFLDVLPAAWGLSELDVETLLDLPDGWLRAWRNHEVQIDDELAFDILELGALQIGIRSLRRPSGYPGFWHNRWAADSPIGARTPWQAFSEDGRPALDAVKRYLKAGIQ
ncbi:hypothetical protein [Sphingomonas xinjiangensis]|uniref:Uncharacterized protein n=1 Tax=Sphingomonas xinjiangensis TaxID=643568 RepID=A0A840YSQ2_9SPHN|nr:hypothetical protein [Sphingomonas xinjiangensis]MBB5712697.1 hypothetical protein [Sphingomonas xinjiangensis]